ncbi:hypothetical protein OAK75_13315 [Bacteriovoracales bacterium]|nr:hypothetical protein [Bacteriovoracales bacterium]
MIKLLKELDLKHKIEEQLYKEMSKRGYWKGKEPFMDWGYYDDKDIVEIDLNEIYFKSKEEYHDHLKSLDDSPAIKLEYKAHDCTRNQFDLNFESQKGVSGFLRIIFSELAYSYHREEREGPYFQCSSFSFINFTHDLIIELKNKPKLLGGIIKDIEKAIWKTYNDQPMH